jgi:hypothetical protein
VPVERDAALHQRRVEAVRLGLALAPDPGEEAALVADRSGSIRKAPATPVSLNSIVPAA